MLWVLAAAADEAERRDHGFVGTEHALLGLLSEPDGIAGAVLRRLGAADAAATQTRTIMDSEGYNRSQRKPGQRASGAARSSGLAPLGKDERDAALSSARRRAGTSRGMFERFSEPARRVLAVAQDEARLLGADQVGSEYLLLGLLDTEDGVAAGVLNKLGITPERMRDAMPGRGATPTVTDRRLGLTPRARMTLELALREALAFGDTQAGTAHILLALTRVSDGGAARALFEFGVDPEQVRGEALRLRRASDGSWQTDAWEESMAPGSTPVQPRIAGPLRATAVRAAVEVAMSAAATNARAENRDIDLGDLLLALAEGWPEDVVAHALAQAGIDASRLREAVEQTRRSGE